MSPVNLPPVREACEPDWRTAAEAALARLRANSRLFPDELSLSLIDQFALKGTLSKTEMRERCAPYLARIILSHVTAAVHGGGRVPKRRGWYRVRPGMPHTIHPDFAAAWIEVPRSSDIS